MAGSLSFLNIFLKLDVGIESLETCFQETFHFCIKIHTQSSFLPSQELFKMRLMSRFRGDHRRDSGSQMLCPGPVLSS